MNRGLRSRHRLMTTALAIVVPVVFVAGLVVRPTMPRNDTLPGMSPVSDFEAGDRFFVGGRLMEARIDDRSLTVFPGEPAPLFADVLIYWHEQPAGDSLPDNAYLIGTLAVPQKRTFELPDAASADTGYLSFYSLANQELLPTLPAPLAMKGL